MSTPRIIFGAGGIGSTKKSFTFTWETPEQVSSLLKTLKELDILELDSAASYPPSNPWHTEKLLGQAKAVEKGFVVDSKISFGGKLNDGGIDFSVNETCRLLGVQKVRTLYCHKPDLNTPLEETAAALDKQFRLGKFERLGLYNYSAEKVEQYFSICEEKGYVKPSIYQGHYNALIRGHEETLMPLLRKYGVNYYAFSPLGGGFLTGKVTFAPSGLASPSRQRTRFQGDSTHQYYINTFDNPRAHSAITGLNKVCDKEDVSVTEVCLRWLINHSALKGEDAIILGAKRTEQLEGNARACREGPLSEVLLKAVEGMSEGGLVHEGSWS